MKINGRLVRKSDVAGKWATIRWTDVGRRDVIILEVIDSRGAGKINRNTDLKVFDISDHAINRITADQITELRSHVTVQ